MLTLKNLRCCGRREFPRRTIVIGVLLALASSSSRAIEVTWAGGSGFWATASSWSNLAVPDSSVDVLIDGGKDGISSVVTLAGAGSARQLTVDTGDILALGNGARLAVHGPTLVIKGNLNLKGTNASTILNLAGDTLFTGGGTTTLGGSYNAIGGSGTKLTIDSGYTVRGSGHLGRDPTNGQTLGSIVNLGTVIAEGGDLSLYGNVTGPGTIAVWAGATLTQYAGAVQTGLLDLSSGGAYVLSGTLEADTVKGHFSQSAGTFAAGVGAAMSSFIGSFSMAGSAVLALNLGDGVAAPHDGLQVSGAFNIGSNASLMLSANSAGGGNPGFVMQAGDVLPLVTVEGTRSGTFAGLVEGATVMLNGLSLNLTYLAGDGNDIALVLTPAVPEPETWLLWLGGLAALGALRKQVLSQ